MTGSARLEIYRHGGDGLLGRFIPYRLHPITVAENDHPALPDEILANTIPRWPIADLLRSGGFPEPLRGGNEARARRWSRLRAEQLLHEDVRDLRAVEDISAMRVLADLLPERIGSLLSMNSLREDVGVAYGTVRSWLKVFEALYHSFLVYPYARRLVRAITATPKLYLFDILQIRASSIATRTENLTALHLLKCCQFWTGLAYGEFDLRFVRDKQRREVDFFGFARR
jgi:predicted AAA+ superfamily ATPase